jgi:hypothetical protein
MKITIEVDEATAAALELLSMHGGATGKQAPGCSSLP